MKTNFALSLSFDGLRLMHRVAGGWHLVGQVALDDADLTGALATLKTAADTLEPSGIRTKLLIPNDQIKYIAIDGTRADDDKVREALHDATPYPVDDLAYDFSKGGGRTYVAAVARETLDEAQQFASEHGFNPICFAAVPEPFTYVGEAFFGATDGKTATRDDEPVIVIGEAKLDLPIPEPTPEPEPVVEPVTQSVPEEPEPTPEPEVDAPKEPEVETSVVETTPDAEPEDAAEEDTTPEAEVIEDPDEAPESELELEPESEPESEPEVLTKEDADPESDPAAEPETPDAPEQEPDAKTEASASPMFASRLRADRNEGRPAPQMPTPAKPDTTPRAEPTFSRAEKPALAVPTGKGTDAMPPLSGPDRDVAATPAVPVITTQTPAPDVVPPITGEAPTALPRAAAIAAASLAIEPDPDDDKPENRSAAATAIGAASAMSGAVGGMFASRRMSRAETKADTKSAARTADAPDDTSRQTVFGARKKPAAKPKVVIGGKPRFLGLILTAILLLFLLAIAAFAALSEEGLARWFGFGSAETQMATDTAIEATDPAASEVAAVPPTDAPDLTNAPDALVTPTAPEGGLVLSPEDATRVYAATGVWQRAPRIPLIPRTTSLDGLALGTSPRPVLRVPASPLASASSVAGDALIATPIDPPAPDVIFDFNADGLVVATPQGAVTPDGILIIAGPPPLDPPTRPGTIAPEITPQDQIAAVIPDTAETLENAPEGVIVIAGRPVIEPPVRTGTASPAAAPQEQALASGDAPLFANDGLLVLTGSPPLLPPVRPGTTVAPVTAAPVVPDGAAQAPVIDAPAAQDLPEGLNVIAGPPPVLPPVRPGTIAPQNDALVDTLTTDITAALATDTAQTPNADTRRPLLRPAGVIQAAAAATRAADTPVVGDLNIAQALSFRPRTRPAGLAPVPAVAPEPEPESEPEILAQQAAVVQTPGLQISPEIAAAVQAAANRPNPIINPTAQAVPVSSRPDTRPRNMDRIVARAAQTQQRAATQVAAVTPRAVAPSGPTGGSVAQNATLDNAINLREVNLIGIYGGSSDRRALVRLANGRYQRVTVGDRLDGGRVTAISAAALSYTKRGRAVTLQVAG